MSNAFYDGFVSALTDGTVGDWDAAAWMLSLHDSTAEFNPTDSDVSSIAGKIGDRVSVSAPVIDNRWAPLHVTVSNVPAGKTVKAVVLSIGSSPVAWFDRGGDLLPIDLPTTGENVDLFGLALRLSVPQ